MKKIQCEFSFPFDLVAIGYRWTFVTWISRYYQLRAAPPQEVMLAGCSTNDYSVPFLLHEGIKKLHGIDGCESRKAWDRCTEAARRTFDAEVTFQQGRLESLPVASQSFDLIFSNRVMEHVRDFDRSVREFHRVLRPQGWALHNFGPLYFSFGGDHCIAEYGKESGYDHLLLNDREYQTKIFDFEHFRKRSDPNASAWARANTFSFLRPAEYFKAFSQHFDLRSVILTISPEALWYRAQFPEKWKALLDQGLAEEDLLVFAMQIVMQKK